ncbi:MAG: hypothetical protein Q9218_004154 [Villophora microphyllina]
MANDAQCQRKRRGRDGRYGLFRPVCSPTNIARPCLLTRGSWLDGQKAPPANGGPGVKPVPGETFNITYGSSTNYESGVAVKTTVKFGDLSVKDFTLGVVTKETDKSSSEDGIMGLGFLGLNRMRPIQQPTLMMAVQEQLQQPVFTLEFKPDSTGNLEFGIVDHSKHKGTLVEAKVNNISEPYWQVDAITLSSGKAKVTQRMLFDSGSGDTMYADATFVADYWHQVAGNNYYGGYSWIFPCKSKLPDMQVSIGSSGSATIPGERFRGRELGPATVFEREGYLNERPRDWNFGIYHAQAPLAGCLPKHLSDKLQTAMVNPHRGPSEQDKFRMFNAQTAELMMDVPTPNVMRFARTHFEDGTFATGNLLIGAEGSRSKVREYLLGPDKAALQELPLLVAATLETLPAELSLKIKDLHDLYCVAYHPDALVAFMALHEVPDPEKPESWRWTFYQTWNDRTAKRGMPRGAEAIREEWVYWAEKLAEPFRSAYLAVGGKGGMYCDRLSEWRTIAWDNHDGRVTLAGDAAHPMTFHRGQGLNNAINDAANLCKELDGYVEGEKGLTEAVRAYEEEMQERGYAAVVSSGENSLMVHDWERLAQSPVFKMGMKPLEKGV